MPCPYSRMMEPLHCMKVVARRTGLTPDLIRVWERRYSAVTPARSRTRRRLYSEPEILRLQLLRDVTRAGHGIGQIARLEEDDLRALLRKEPATMEAVGTIPPPPPRDHFAEGLAAILRLDAEALEAVLSRAASELGRLALLEQVLAPLIDRIGDLWQKGELRIANEHMATAVIRAFLTGLTRFHALPEGAPRILVTTPVGHVHELGAILAAVAAHHQGWRVTYLGPSLPAEEIAGAALQHRVRAVALSLVYPEDDPSLETEFTHLRRLLPPCVALLVGGRAAPAYRALIENLEIISPPDLSAFRSKLDELQKKKLPRC
jgi:MerR family transcriptional regulator, light-induced transcriptional regulator